MKKVYVVTKMDDNYDVEVLGAFNNHAEAVEAIKKSIFSYADNMESSADYFETRYIPDFEYQIHETGVYNVELR